MNSESITFPSAFRNPQKADQSAEASDPMSVGQTAAEIEQDNSGPSTPPSAFKAAFIGFCLGLILATVTLFSAPILREWTFSIFPYVKAAVIRYSADMSTLQQNVLQLEKRVSAFKKKYNFLLPREPYLIVDTSENRITLMSKNKIQHQGICSTGSYVLLKATDNRQWIFKTPRGMYRILGKVEYPVWRMPDWAFIEEGRPVPPQNSPERYEEGVLGEYAMSFGDGYIINGTLYKRFLGMPVTHGCVRLDDEDLRTVYHAMHIGSKVFIY